MSETEHTLEIDADSLGVDYTAECSCGWVSGPHRSEDTAVDAWENHCDVVFMEATGG